MSIKKAVILGIILEILLGAAAASFYFLSINPARILRRMPLSFRLRFIRILRLVFA